jgi:hypothetical protein
MACIRIKKSKPLNKSDRLASPVAKGPEDYMLEQKNRKASEVEVDE